MKEHLDKQEKTNLSLTDENERIKGQLMESSNKLALIQSQHEKLKQKMKQNQQLKDEAKRNPKRAAAAVSAVVVRGTRKKR